MENGCIEPRLIYQIASFFRFLFHFFDFSAIFASKSFYDAIVAFHIHPIHYIDDDPLRGYLIFFFTNHRGNKTPIKRQTFRLHLFNS